MGAAAEENEFDRGWVEGCSARTKQLIVDFVDNLSSEKHSFDRQIVRAAHAIRRWDPAYQDEATKGEPMADSRKKKQDPFDNVDVQVQHRGREIVLPAQPQNMGLESAIKVLQRKKEEEESEVNVYEQVEAFPWDGAQAFMKAMRDTYGWASAVPTPTMFGSRPPTFVTIKTGPGINDNTQIIWGSFELPNVSGRLETRMNYEDGRPKFAIVGSCKRREHQEIKKLADLTRQYAVDQSIYKGRAIRLFCDEDGDLDFDKEPEFMDTEKTRPEDLIFSRHVEEQVVTNVFTPVEKTESCVQHGVPLSRGILCEGPYGVGKTLLSAVTAKKCEENGWTYIVIDDAKSLSLALEFAKLYKPAVVFAEDIDRVVSGERNREMDRILNTIDGVTGKSNQIITILTTNDVKAINPAMLRPGRLDAVISIQPPDAEAAQRLMRSYGAGLIADDDPLTEAGEELNGAIPAVIREVVERAKLFALSRANGSTINLTDSDLAASARGMNQHLALLNRKEEEPPIEYQAGAILQKLMGGGKHDLRSAASNLSKQAGNIGRTMDMVQKALKRLEDSGSADQNTLDELRSIRQKLGPMHTDIREIRKEL